jgi:hypothetical protein
MTDAESRLWHRVRRKQILGVQFYWQKPIGPYIVDFYASAAKSLLLGALRSGEKPGVLQPLAPKRQKDAEQAAWPTSALLFSMLGSV